MHKKFIGRGPIEGAHRNPLVTEAGPLKDPQGYQASPELANAVNVALTLQMPLLVTGEPGTGKTQLAYRLAAELGKTELLRFDTKSSSQATDLFYHFDSIRQFGQSQLHAVAGKELPESREFVHFAAMGKAILRTYDPAEIEKHLGPAVKHSEPTFSVVMIDEIDKAPRDFPNDLLNQIENLEFSIPELNLSFQANRTLSPVVVITSNSEKQLPEPFLRRCVYHHIEFPSNPAEIEMILSNRLQQLPLQEIAYQEALRFFFQIREHAGLIKKPSTSELIDWLRALSQQDLAPDQSIKAQKSQLIACLGALLKTTEDKRIAQSLLP